MIDIAWVSRHEPLESQVEWLSRVLGGSIRITHISMTFSGADEVCAMVRASNAKYAVVVLPLSMIARLVDKCRDITWLYAIMEPVHSECIGKGCPLYNEKTDVILTGNTVRHLRFREFKRIKQVKLELEDLK